MAEPAVPSVEGTDAKSAKSAKSEPETPTTPDVDDDDLPDAEDVTQTEAVVESDDMDGGLFGGTEDAETEPEGEVDRDPEEFADEDVLPGGGLGDGADDDAALSDSEVATAINEGAARMAVVGLDDDEQDELADEFEEVFEAFRLGHFGAETADEYLMVDDDVDPIWGFASAMAACAVFALYMRPDTDEQLEQIAGAVGNIGGGGGGDFL